MAGVVLQQRLAQSRVGGILKPAVDGRADLVAGGISLLAEPRLHERPRHLGDVWRLDRDDGSAVPRGHRRVSRFVVFGLVDVAQLEQPSQDVGTPSHPLLRIGDRVEPRRRFRQPRNHPRSGRASAPRPGVRNRPPPRRRRRRRAGRERSCWHRARGSRPWRTRARSSARAGSRSACGCTSSSRPRKKFLATCMVMVLPPGPFSPVRTRCSTARVSPCQSTPGWW